MHEVEAVVDLVQRQVVGHEHVERQVALHVHVDELRDVGASSGAAEAGALDGTAGDEKARYDLEFLTPAGHASGYIDRLILGENHIWRSTGSYDPEGLISTLPAILSTFIGWLFGQQLIASDDHWQRLRQWLIWGATLTAAGWLLGLVMPINKQLWTPSYALFMGGLAGLWLALCYWLIEVREVRAWSRPFVMLGLNPLALFWLSGFLARNLMLLKFHAPEGSISVWRWLYLAGFQSWLPDYPASLAFALANVGFWLLVAWGLYWRGWFIKL